MPNARNKGNTYERDIMNELKEFFPEVVTSRSESKRADDKQKDLMYTDPFVIQCKAYERGQAYHDMLKQMAIDNDGLPVILHKRNHKGTVAVMPKDVFYMFLRAYLDEKRAKEI